MSKLGESIKAELRRQGMSIQQLSKLTGIPVGTLYNLTKSVGAASTNRNNIDLINRALGTSFSYRGKHGLYAEIPFSEATETIHAVMRGMYRAWAENAAPESDVDILAVIYKLREAVRELEGGSDGQ